VNALFETVTDPKDAMFSLLEVRLIIKELTPDMLVIENDWLTDEEPVLIATRTNPPPRYAVT